MAEILVIHPTLMAKGGGESVCMNVIEVLQDRHNLTILTVEPPHLDELNEYYATSVENIDVRLLDGLSATSHRLPRHRFNRLKMVLLNRHIVNQDLGDDFDLVISTSNELSLPYDSIQYIHMPNFGRDVLPDTGKESPVYSLYEHLCHTFVPMSNHHDTETVYLANSDWMAKQTTDTLGERPRTVHPPVYTTDFNPRPWNERENGFVTVGRISPEKNILRNIEFVSKLNQRNHDIHYHILGPHRGNLFQFTESYSDQVQSKASEYDFIHLEGEVSRERLVEMISTHKYGLHGMDHEHFGIAVAELVAGGTIPFIPRGGGQQEIVGHCEKVMYDSVSDAVEKADSILRDEEEQQRVRQQIPDIETRFGRERFQREIKQITESVLP